MIFSFANGQSLSLALQVSTYCLLSFVHSQNSRLRRRAYIEQTPVWLIPKVRAMLVQCWTNTWLWLDQQLRRRPNTNPTRAYCSVLRLLGSQLSPP